MASKSLTTTTSGYTGLLIATETALNSETLARILGANVLLSRAVGLAYYIAMPTGHFYTQPVLADTLRATTGMEWTLAGASRASARGIGNEYDERFHHHGLNLTEEVLAALECISALEKHGATACATPPFEALIVDYAVRWTRCGVLLRAFNRDGIYFDRDEIATTFVSASRQKREEKGHDAEVNWLVRQLGAEAARELNAIAGDWRKVRAKVSARGGQFTRNVESVEALLRRKSDTSVALRARSHSLRLRIEQLLSVFRVPFENVPPEYAQLADLEEILAELRSSWYAAHRVVQMTDTEMRLYFE